MKTCARCKEEKTKDCFYVTKRNKDGLSRMCKICDAEANKASRSRNKDKIKIQSAIAYQKNRESIKTRVAQYHKDNRDARLAKQREYRSKNKEKLNAESIANKKIRYKYDPYWRALRQIQSRFRIAITRGGYTEKSSLYTILGCDWSVFKAHIESQFKSGMSWGNRSDWHIDHKLPLSLASTENEMLKLWDYKNLQPLWPAENISKGSMILDKYIEEVGYLSANI